MGPKQSKSETADNGAVIPTPNDANSEPAATSGDVITTQLNDTIAALPADVVHVIFGSPDLKIKHEFVTGYASPEDRIRFSLTSKYNLELLYGPPETRSYKITRNFLRAVAYGMESESVNKPVKPSDAAGLFNPNIYVDMIVKKLPELLLARGQVKDWAGREFTGRNNAFHNKDEGISPWELMIYYKDFKMMERVIDCVRQHEACDEIIPQLIEQAEQVMKPVDDRGGISYTWTYQRPKVDENGIPTKDAAGKWESEQVTEARTENHFDLRPLIAAYEDYERNHVTRTDSQQDACWIRLIGTLQRFLPLCDLQRYFDPDMPFDPLPKFNGTFRRSSDFYNWITSRRDSLFASSLSSDLAILRCGMCDNGRTPWQAGGGRATRVALAAICQLDEVSTNEVEKIIQQLSWPQHDAGPRL